MLFLLSDDQKAKVKKNLERIIDNYEHEEVEDLYSTGGGLSNNSFMSNRNEAAKASFSRKTKGETRAMFKKAVLARSTEAVANFIDDVIFWRDLEWHHAGKLPKQYGGGMRKVYYYNSKQIVTIALHFMERLDLLKKKEKQNTEV